MIFNLQQAKDLLEMFGDEDSEIVVEHVRGKTAAHSGSGLYAHYVDDTREGSQFLGNLPTELATSIDPNA